MTMFKIIEEFTPNPIILELLKDFELVKKIIDEAVILGANSIVFTGGEATLYPKLNEIISYAKNHHLKTELYTMCH